MRFVQKNVVEAGDIPIVPGFPYVFGLIYPSDGGFIVVAVLQDDSDADRVFDAYEKYLGEGESRVLLDVQNCEILQIDGNWELVL